MILQRSAHIKRAEALLSFQIVLYLLGLIKGGLKLKNDY